ncbi:MAG: response regulator [Candidatus Wallbacteria bacterium]|nr:response regulator [Candidatus Wallbacteria bacterium]
MTSVLLVEDEALLRQLTRDYLLERGYRVRDLENGEQAMRLLSGVRFDAVVADLKLPGASGLEILQHVRRIRPPSVVILMTAFGTVPLAVDAMRHGAFDFITKPFRVEELEARLREGLAELTASQCGSLVRRPDLESIQPLAISMAHHEREELERALAATHGRRAEAARRLRISRNALWKKLRR